MGAKKVLLTGILVTSLLPLYVGGTVKAESSLTTTEGIVTNLLNSREDKIENFKNISAKGTAFSEQAVASPELDYLYDEALNIIRVMEETTGRVLKDFNMDFKQTSSENIENNTIITGELTQTIIWEGSDEDTALKDIVTITVSDENQVVTKSTFPKSAITGDELVKKAMNNLEKYATKNNEIAQKAQEQSYSKKAGIDIMREEFSNRLGSTTDSIVSPAATYTFNRTQSKAYALTYAINNNTQYWTFENDCTNFASQVLNAGGIPKQKIVEPYEGMPNWWMNTGAAGQWLYAVPWVQADSFFKLIRSTDTIHGYGKPGPEYLYEGDIISYDKGSDYTMNHTAVITNRDTPSSPLVSYHTTNRKNVTWDFYIINTAGSVIPYFTHIL
ncbi:amidase domain-containing protein [Paenibacillus sp. DMB5]|uniref:amidase domain-containing protein n=1 Tax=Paenibacillus sp. DMB5 TaxID=1780103 RepID=UPI00076DD9AF|nr:amidase domain-containing protein [Paenibacillus sp. DMB5]KUP25116.1 hypothetical protein AWJ19_29435 [Paenibacillus sp. DMB5]